MAETTIAVQGLRRIERGAEAWELARATYDDLLDLLRELDPEEWERPTVCAPWTVADVVRHVVGAAEGHASILVGVRQQVRAQRERRSFGGNPLDAWTGGHVRDRAALGPAELVAELEVLASRAVAGRERFPAPLRRIPVPVDASGSVAEGTPERVTLGELTTVTYTRDTWLHRLDIARATGRDLVLDRDTDGRIVEDVVAEWAERHGQPFRLRLTGDLAATYAAGTGGPEIELDAVELAWVLSGRSEPASGQPGAELLRHRLLF